MLRADDVVDAVKRSDEVLAVASHADETFAAASHVDEVGDIGKQVDNFNPPCKRNSFTPETYVWTANGFKPISTVDVDDLVYAYNEATRTTGLYTVTATISHLDPVVWTLIINGERVDTTPEHPFYVDGRWVYAADLRVGDDVRRGDGSTGEVQRIEIAQRPQVMYNLSVAEAHTFFVGQQQWLVHNCGGDSDYVYRALAPGENPSNGLTARAPDAGNSPLSHVAGKRNSQWISTTADKSVALNKYDKGNGVVKINLKKVNSEVVDLRGGIPKGGRFSHYAKADKEILIKNSVPASAIERVK